MFLHVSVCPQGGGGVGRFPSMPCRWYPSMPCRSPRGRGVSQHALQVSRPTPKGELEGSGWGDVFRPTPRGQVEGSGLGGSPGPHPGGEVEGSGWGSPGHTTGGVTRPTPEGVSRLTPRGVGGLQAHTGEEVYPSMHWGRPPLHLMATAAGGTHPTGMHSCFLKISRSDKSLRWFIRKPYDTLWELYVSHVSNVYGMGIPLYIC